MRINIHTYYYGNNYGALLQSLFFKTYLKKQFNVQVNFHSYQPKNFLYREEIKPIIKKNIIHSINSIKRFLKFRKWKKKYIQSKPNTQFIIDQENSNCLSFYGSDEIWNFNNPFFGYDPFFFGKKNQGFKCSYAASFGTSASDEIGNYMFEEIKLLLKNFKFISVRDKSSHNFLKKNFNIDSEIVLDPIFLIDNELELFLEKKERITNYNYCLIYGKFFTEKEIAIIINFSKKKNLKIVSVGYYNKWANLNFVDSNPSDFLNFFNYSDYIFTSMFHGVLFSVKYNKNFLFTNDPYRKNKLDYFIKLLKIEDRLFSNDTNIEDTINYSAINLELNKQKKLSKEFINKSVKYFLNNEN